MLIIGNWKMHKTAGEAAEYIAQLAPAVAKTGVDVGLAVPFTALYRAVQAARGTTLRIGAQNMHDAEQGAFTGEISVGMLKAEEVDFVLLGHSERRTLFGESNEFIRRKLQRALAAALTVVLCLGETDEERASGRTQAVLGTQMRECLAGVSAQQMQRIVIAYEPVWAIGTGKSATAEQAQEVHAFCRHQIASLFAKEAAVACKLLYGGSVKAQNATKLMEQPDIDGALVGGASLTVQEFVNIISQLRSA